MVVLFDVKLNFGLWHETPYLCLYRSLGILFLKLCWLVRQVEEKAVGDGDGMIVYVDVYEDTRELENLPIEIQDAVDRRRDARARRDFKTADALQRQIEKSEYKSVLASLLLSFLFSL